MGNKCKRFLTMLLMALLLVSAMSMNVLAAETDTAELECYVFGDVNGDDVIDQKDAIYLLYHATLGEELYPLNGRDGDMDGDGDIDKDDAIRLLFHTFPSLAQAYPLAKEGTIHAYFAPVWTWNETDGETKCMAATVTVKCACGEEHSATEDVYPEVKAATCTEDGYEKYSVTITVGGSDYTGSYEVVLPATGHNVTATCTGEAACQNSCGYTVAALGHSWEEISRTDATCGADGEKISKCAACGEEKTEVIPATSAHEYGEEVAVAVAGKNCTFVKVKTCSGCGDTISSGEYEEHSYTDKVTVTKQPTCTGKGEKVYTCDKCDSTKTEEIAVNPEAHDWQSADNSHFTCACGATKDVVAVENDTDVSTDTLAQSELALAEGTALSMDDDSVENLPAEQIQVSVENVAAEGETPIYDFNMTYVDENGEKQPVSQFSGTITVTLPYELGDDEDPESVAVQYINGNGETENIHATYANGYITFTTNHFSYYTVTRLSPAERCALYGHKYGKMPLTREATCTEGGYTYEVCQRCAHVNVLSTTEAKGHSYNRTTVAATCIEAGKHTDVCAVCNHTVVTEIPAVGHGYELTEESVAPGCTTSGKNIYKCEACGDSYEEIVEALGHAFGDIEEKSATCEENGYRKHTCGRCGHEETLAEYSAKGHRFPTSDEEDAEVKPEWDWVWEDEDLIDVTVVIHCVEEGCTYTKTLTAVVTEEDNTGCEGGDVTYYAQAGYNGHGFEHPPYKKHKEGEGHKHGDKWHNDAVKHYHKCSTCKEMFDSAAHNWDEGTVISEATCVDKGQTVYKCTVCGYEKTETVAATGKHDLQNGVCADCGYKANDCAHIRNKEIRVDLSEHGACGGWVQISTCECGENAYPWDWSLDCEFEEKEEERTSEEGVKYTVVTSTCKECGLTFENYGYEYCTEDPCEAGYCYGSKFTIDGEVIVDGETSGIYESHPTGWGNEGEIIDLTKKGLCSEILVKETCPCGERSWHYGESRCNWEYLEGSIFEETGVTEICTNCGAKRNRLDSEIIDEANCAYVFTQKYTYYVNDKEVYSYSNIEQHEWHNYTYTNFKLMGDSCEDGMTFDVVCMICGETGYGYESWHMPINTKIMDLSAYDICYDMAYQSVCACGLAIREGGLEVGPDGSYCDWLPKYEGINKSVEYCSICGATKTQTLTVSGPDENCMVKYTHKYDYADKNGKHIVTVYADYYEAAHEYEETYKLLGDSCEDGVEFTNTCIHCGYSYTVTQYGHNERVVQTWDVSNLGMCGRKIELYACACGQEQHLNYTDGGNCSFYRVDKLTSECRYCGVRRVEEQVHTAIDSCHSKVQYTFTFSRNGKSQSVTYDGYATNHELVYEMKLMEGATDCTDGYTATRICQKCDYRDNYGIGYTHNTQRIATKRLDNGELCGEFYLDTVSCACGLESWTDTRWENGSCGFSWYYDEKLDREIGECDSCGTIQYYELSETPVEGTCDVNSSRHNVFLKDGKELFSYDESWVSTRHGWVYDFNLKGKTCNDGYDYTATCQYCGATDSGTNCYGHRDHETWTKIGEGENVCSAFYMHTAQCACGQSNYGWGWNSECTFSWQYDELLDQWCNKCTKCGLAWTDKESYSGTGDPCVWNTNRNFEFYLNGKKIGAQTAVYKSTHHSYVYDFTLYGATCDDGYTYTATCKFCGDYMESNGVEYGCSWRMMDQIMLYNGEDACGAVVYYSDGCACGNLRSSWTSSSCNFQWQYDEKLGYEVRKCTDCGLVWMTEETVGDPDANCKVICTTEHTFVMGNEYYVSSTESVEERHSWTREFYLLGEYCKDGYTMSTVCTHCGIREDDSGVYYNDCSTWDMGDERVIYDGKDVCGPITVESRRCACGRVFDQYISTTCYTNEYWDEDLDSWVHECYSGCGLKYAYSSAFLREEDCVDICQGTITIYIGDQVIPYNYTYGYQDHQWVYTYEMVDGATSCEDGYYRIRVCSDCGYEDGRSGIYTGHDTNCVERYDLADYGLCGGGIYVYSCACGQERYISWGEDCDWYYTDNVDEVHGPERYCEICGAYSYYYSDSELNRENCSTEGKFHYLAVRDGETLLTMDWDTASIQHTYIAVDMRLDEGASDCNDGYQVTYECQYCGDSYEYSGSGRGHDKKRVKFIDLEEIGACSGYLEQYECPCGLHKDFGYDHPMSWNNIWTEEDENGTVHTYQEGYCNKCDLKVLEHYYIDLDEGSCDGTFYRYYTVTLGDTLNVTLVESYPTTSHDWGEPVYALEEGSEVCTDGVSRTYYCQREGCGATSYTGFTPSGHYFMNVTKSIDLAQYGSICGETLNYLECPCGAEYRWSFDEENHCDLDQKSTDRDWLTEVIERNDLGEKLVHDSQYTTEGYIYSHSYAYIFTCAVTDPEACGLKVRMAEYWVKNGCEVTEYQTWQLGYDADTGECQYEFTVATGGKHAYHDYEYTSLERELENGNTLFYGARYDCPDCKSFVRMEYFYEDGKYDEYVKYEDERINTLNNGEMKRYYRMYAYGHEEPYEHNGETYSFRYMTVDRYEYSYADGSEYWAQYDYTYNFEEGCVCTYVYTNSNGAAETHTGTCHHTYHSGEDIEQPTCTQYGSYRYWYTCYVCGEITSEYTGSYSPVAHYWYWNEDLQTYVCSVCELENINGASGVVVMEDLTNDEKWGSETDYVIGYWNRQNVKFSIELSVIFNDRDEEHEDGNQFVLTGIEIADHTKESDGFVGKSFNKEAAYEAAEAKMAEQGYTGSFSIRINFVPVNDETDLDYAITFDPIGAAA